MSAPFPASRPHVLHYSIAFCQVRSPLRSNSPDFRLAPLRFLHRSYALAKMAYRPMQYDTHNPSHKRWTYTLTNWMHLWFWRQSAVQKTAEELKKQQERDAEERQKYLSSRVPQLNIDGLDQCEYIHCCKPKKHTKCFWHIF